jgi:sugar lactone lactonase YvrE
MMSRFSALFGPPDTLKTLPTRCPVPFDYLPITNHGPEDVAIDADGQLIVGTENGNIVRINPQTRQQQVLANTGGRPLGIECLANGDLIVCDARLGILQVNPEQAQVKILADRFEGRHLRLCNNASVTQDGTIYFSQSTIRRPLEDFRQDLVDHLPTGRFFRLRPNQSTPELLKDHLAFANGVTLSPDESFVLVAESGRHQINRYWLKGPKQGQWEHFAHLEGVPDNLCTDESGLFWVAIASPQDWRLGLIKHLPTVVRIGLGHLQRRMDFPVIRQMHIQAFDQHGNVVHRLQWCDDDFHMPTGLRRKGNLLYISSLAESALMMLDLRSLDG